MCCFSISLQVKSTGAWAGKLWELFAHLPFPQPFPFSKQQQ